VRFSSTIILVMLWVFVAVPAGSPAAKADTSTSPADIQKAKIAYKRATAQFGIGNYAEAAVAYEEAFTLKPDPALLFNAAQAYRLAGNRERAIKLYRNYLRLYSEGSAAPEARKHMETLEAEEKAASQKVTPLPATPSSDSPAVPTMVAPPVDDKPIVTATATQADDDGLLSSPWFWGGTALVVVAVVVAVVASGGETNPKPSWGSQPLGAP
jgi:tetratricopeptide (TPR) repeat protein